MLTELASSQFKQSRANAQKQASTTGGNSGLKCSTVLKRGAEQMMFTSNSISHNMSTTNMHKSCSKPPLAQQSTSKISTVGSKVPAPHGQQQSMTVPTLPDLLQGTSIMTTPRLLPDQSNQETMPRKSHFSPKTTPREHESQPLNNQNIMKKHAMPQICLSPVSQARAKDSQAGVNRYKASTQRTTPSQSSALKETIEEGKQQQEKINNIKNHNQAQLPSQHLIEASTDPQQQHHQQQMINTSSSNIRAASKSATRRMGTASHQQHHHFTDYSNQQILSKNNRGSVDLNDPSGGLGTSNTVMEGGNGFELKKNHRVIITMQSTGNVQQIQKKKGSHKSTRVHSVSRGSRLFEATKSAQEGGLPPSQQQITSSVKRVGGRKGHQLVAAKENFQQAQQMSLNVAEFQSMKNEMKEFNNAQLKVHKQGSLPTEHTSAYNTQDQNTDFMQGHLPTSHHLNNPMMTTASNVNPLTNPQMITGPPPSSSQNNINNYQSIRQQQHSQNTGAMASGPRHRPRSSVPTANGMASQQIGISQQQTNSNNINVARLTDQQAQLHQQAVQLQKKQLAGAQQQMSRQTHLHSQSPTHMSAKMGVSATGTSGNGSLSGNGIGVGKLMPYAYESTASNHQQTNNQLGGYSLRITGITTTNNPGSAHATTAGRAKQASATQQQFFGKRMRTRERNDQYANRQIHASSAVMNSQISLASDTLTTQTSVKKQGSAKFAPHMINMGSTQQEFDHTQYGVDMHDTTYQSGNTMDSKKSKTGASRPMTSKQKFNKTSTSISMLGGGQQNLKSFHNIGSSPAVIMEPSAGIANSGGPSTKSKKIPFIDLNKRQPSTTQNGHTTLGGASSSQHSGSNTNLRTVMGNMMISQRTNDSSQNATITHAPPSQSSQQTRQQNSKGQQPGSASPVIRYKKLNTSGSIGMHHHTGSSVNAGGQTTKSCIQMMPSTPESYKRTKRILFARRMSLMDRPLLIIEFQGVLGDFIKKPCGGLRDLMTKKMDKRELLTKDYDFWQQFGNLQIRPGAVEGLKHLSKMFQLVVFSRETLEESWFVTAGGQVPSTETQTKLIKQFLLANGADIKLDAFYASTVPPKHQGISDDYSQIFIDFGLDSQNKINDRVLFVNSLANDFLFNIRATNPPEPKQGTSGNSPRAKCPPQVPRIQPEKLDPHGYFLFDFSVQPPVPLARGIPITLEIKPAQLHQSTDKTALAEDTSSTSKTLPTENMDRQMPTTLIVPDVRTQSAKHSCSFMHIFKSIMMIALLGQKTKFGTQLRGDFLSTKGGLQSLKESQIKVNSKTMVISATSLASNAAKKGSNNPNFIRHGKKREASGNPVRESSVENAGNDTPTSVNSSNYNSSNNGNGKNFGLFKGAASNTPGTQGFNIRVQNTQSSRTAATTSNGFEQTNSSDHSTQANNKESLFQQRSQSFGSDQGLRPSSPSNTTPDQEVAIDLQDPQFFTHLSWSRGVHLMSKEEGATLGMQTLNSDIVWRYYKKQALERIQLRKIHEDRMAKLDTLVNKTLSNDTLVANRRENIDLIFTIFRRNELKGNPFGLTMARNYKFFLNMNVALRGKLRKDLQKWNAINIHQQCDPMQQEEMTQLLNKQHQRLEVLLEKNHVHNSLVVLGLEAPSSRNMATLNM